MAEIPHWKISTYSAGPETVCVYRTSSTVSHHCTPYSANSIVTALWLLITRTSILLLLFHQWPCLLLSSCFPVKIVYPFLFSSQYAVFHISSSLMITIDISAEEDKFRSSFLHKFLNPPNTFLFLDPYILLTTNHVLQNVTLFLKMSDIQFHI
jgi:hypothetical protein